MNILWVMNFEGDRYTYVELSIYKQMKKWHMKPQQKYKSCQS